ncbi:MAG: argininosuccinate lyase [Deltaproteobacteria bacterium]|nr:argininosuccinate lyase [Deltaproteobacteria bacterium]
MTTEAKGARGGRFAIGLGADAAAMNASIDFDRRLARFDVRGSQAHARMLGRIGVLSADEVTRIVEGLAAVLGELERGELQLEARLEDIHMNVEARLTQLIGEAGAKLHTARSRNDQVALDLRLYARDAAEVLMARIDALEAALVGQARRTVDVIAPGYTHLQRAQPVRLGHHLLAYFEMLERDRGRLGDAARRAGESPLGAGALAASSFALDRSGVAAELGFHGVTHNSLDAVGDRDFAIELTAACALTATHLSRLGEELVLWASQEFGFARLPEGYCSGSSLMPQKVNPDIPELVRAKVGRVVGDLVTLLMVVKGLPLAYNKDLQETQEPLYDAVETTAQVLGVMAGLVRGLEFDAARLARAVDGGHLTATELADHLVGRGVPFRRAHDQSGAAVRRAIELGVELRALPLDELRAVAPEVGPDVGEWLDPARAADRRDVVGGPARGRVMDEIARAEALLAARLEPSQ